MAGLGQECKAKSLLLCSPGSSLAKSPREGCLGAFTWSVAYMANNYSAHMMDRLQIRLARNLLVKVAQVTQKPVK